MSSADKKVTVQPKGLYVGVAAMQVQGKRSSLPSECNLDLVIEHHMTFHSQCDLYSLTPCMNAPSTQLVQMKITHVMPPKGCCPSLQMSANTTPSMLPACRFSTLSRPGQAITVCIEGKVGRPSE